MGKLCVRQKQIEAQTWPICPTTQENVEVCCAKSYALTKKVLHLSESNSVVQTASECGPCSIRLGKQLWGPECKLQPYEKYIGCTFSAPKQTTHSAGKTATFNQITNSTRTLVNHLNLANSTNSSYTNSVTHLL